MDDQALVLFNGRVHSMGGQITTAIAIDGDRVQALGDDRTLQTEYSGRARFVDLTGRVVLPGLTDAHIHLEHYALGLQKVDCETGTRTECLERVAARTRGLAPGEWVFGHGWNQNNWVEGYGDAADLDSIAPENPVYLTAKSLHAGWANSMALRMANIGSTTPDPQGGRLGRDHGGQPNGLLFENAMDLISRVIPEPTVEQVADAIREAMPRLLAMGLTGVHDFDRSRCFSALQILQQTGTLQLRVVKNIPVETLPQAVELGLRSGFGNDFLRIGAVKIFADGALGPHTAAMLQPYEDDPQNRGMLLLDSEEILEYGRMAMSQGLPISVHAIGDRANHEVLNAVEQLRSLEIQTGSRDSSRLRHRIEHVQLLHPQDVHRLAELGVVASMQPIHATSDMEMADQFWGKRSHLAYAWKSQLAEGAVLAFGSDAPVESPNPFWGIHAAVTRRRENGAPGPDGWYPEQRLDVAQAIEGFTRGAAYAVGMEDRLGRLAPGYLADLLVLDEDPFTCPVEQLRNLRPTAVMVGGAWALPLET